MNLHRIVLFMIIIFINSCSVTRMLPTGPVISQKERERILSEKDNSKTKYLSEAKVEYPVIPLTAFGISYDLDIIIVTEHPQWNMHEYARIKTPDGNIWLAKDSREKSLDQLLTSNIKDIHKLPPEIPLKIKTWLLKVIDKSDNKDLDISISYENHDKELIKAHFKEPIPKTDMDKRNGSTMGHSRNHVLAVLDISKRDFGSDASMTYNGKQYDIKRI